MKRNNLITPLTVLVILFTLILIGSDKVFAHCDGMDGPVVTAAKKALETGNINLVLIWVKEKDEAEIRKAFQQTLPVRKMSPEAKELADMYFFETLVRIHRVGEGAPYTGLKPAGRDLGPSIPAADKAIADGDAEPLLKLLIRTIQEGIHEQFKHVIAEKNYKADDVKAGREYIEAYVTFVHYVEGLYETAKKVGHGHYAETEEGTGHKE